MTCLYRIICFYFFSSRSKYRTSTVEHKTTGDLLHKDTGDDVIFDAIKNGNELTPLMNPHWKLALGLLKLGIMKAGESKNIQDHLARVMFGGTFNEETGQVFIQEDLED